MTLTIEIPDIRVEDVRAFAQARGQEIGDFVAETVLAAVDEREEGREPDLGRVIAEAWQLYDSGVRGSSLEEAFRDIRLCRSSRGFAVLEGSSVMFSRQIPPA